MTESVCHNILVILGLDNNSKPTRRKSWNPLGVIAKWMLQDVRLLFPRCEFHCKSDAHIEATAESAFLMQGAKLKNGGHDSFRMLKFQSSFETGLSMQQSNKATQ